MSRPASVPRFDWRQSLSQTARRLSRRLCQFIPIWAWQRVFPEPVVFLCYHMVSDARVAHLKHYPFLGTAEFERDLNELEARFRYVSYEQAIERRSQAHSRSEASMCITFDDGFAECASVVRPILLRHRATCIFFIVTDLIDNRTVFYETRSSLCIEAILRHPPEMVEGIVRDLGLEKHLPPVGDAHYATLPVEMVKHWEQFEPRLRPLLIWLLTIKLEDAAMLEPLCQRLQVDAAAYVEKVRPYLSTQQILQLRSDGFTIGAHSLSHRRLQDLSRAEAEREIVESCRAIHILTGQPSVPFAFPYFGDGLDRHWLAELRERHPFIGLFFDTRGLRQDSPAVAQRVFGERIEETGSIDRLLRRAWLRRLA
jgi:peptidoglycan/xylan/chitin deacetylase (PgdA/CDA1 family)